MIEKIHDKDTIESFLQNNPYLHLYALGDLDDFFWKDTIWYAFSHKQEIKSLILLYKGSTLPTVLALEEDNVSQAKELLSAIKGKISHPFECHLSSHLNTHFRELFPSHLHHGTHYKMRLKTLKNFSPNTDLDLSALSPNDTDDILELFQIAYPENWFIPRMLETGKYLGLRDKNKLVAISGIHVFSKKYKVASLGNITTHPEYRKKGLSSYLTYKLCENLLKEVDHIGLNVHDKNESAIRCYQKIGFEIHTKYEEYLVE